MSELNVSNINATNIDTTNLETDTLAAPSGLQLPQVTLGAFTDATRPTSGVTAGTIIWNTDSAEVQVWNGEAWVNISKKSAATLPENGLYVHLDATNTDSYPGNGVTWTDLTVNGHNFQVPADRFVGSGGSIGSYFAFTTGTQAKNGGDISLSGDVSYVVVTRPLNSTSQWRTLTRSYSADHHVIIQSGAWNIGMYDNNGSGFIGTGYSQQSLPGYGSNSFMVMIWRWSNTDSPTYELHVNGISRGTISNSNARYNRGFGSIGGYHGGNTNPGSGSQPWGDIKMFAAYNRRLTAQEISDIQVALESQGYLD